MPEGLLDAESSGAKGFLARLGFVGLDSVFCARALALAGLLVLGGTGWGYWEWGNNRAAGLTLIVLAMIPVLVVIGAAGGASQLQSATAGTTRRRWHWWFLAALMAAHGLIAWQYERMDPGDYIDCYQFQRDAAQSLLHGVDPFGTTHANIYNPLESSRFYGPGVVVNGRVQVGLQYPPVTFLSALPGYLMGNVSYGYVAAALVSALLVFLMAPGLRGMTLAAFVLLDPVTFIMENSCWTELLVWMLLCAALYTAARWPRWLPLALGLFLASKQYNLLALPFLGYFVCPFSWRACWKLAAASLAVGLATLLPFALWNFHALWHDLVLFHLAQPFRSDSLSFVVPFPRYALIGQVLLLVFIVWAMRRPEKHAVIFPVAYGMALLLFVLASKQAFANYYFLIAHAFLLAAALWPGKAELSASPCKM